MTHRLFIVVIRANCYGNQANGVEIQQIFILLWPVTLTLDIHILILFVAHCLVMVDCAKWYVFVCVNDLLPSQHFFQSCQDDKLSSWVEYVLKRGYYSVLLKDTPQCLR